MEQNTKIEPIKLADGTELTPFDKETKEILEAEILEVLNKYQAIYLPSIREENTLTSHSKVATLFLLKKTIPTPYIENGESNTTEETPEVK